MLIMAKVKEAEVLVFATPIYYYEMAGQMKTLLDRLNPLFPSDYSFRDVYMIATAAENDNSAFEKAYSGLQGWVDCFPKAELKGIVTAVEYLHRMIRKVQQLILWNIGSGFFKRDLFSPHST